MPILSINDAAATFRHRCGRCGCEDDLHLNPAKEHVAVNSDGSVLTTRACPDCSAHDGTITVECFRLNIPSWEAGEGPHPGSLVGTTLPGPRQILPGGEVRTVMNVVNVVSEHTEGYHLLSEHVTQAKLLRQMQRHPHLAPHAPLRADPEWLPGKPRSNSSNNGEKRG